MHDSKGTFAQDETYSSRFLRRVEQVLCKAKLKGEGSYVTYSIKKAPLSKGGDR